MNKSQEPRFSVLITAWLTGFWMLLFAQMNFLTVTSGLIVALVVQLLFPLPHSGAIRRLHPGAFAELCVRFGWDMVRAAIHVATVVITGRNYRCAIVRVPLREADEYTIAIVAAMTNLVPGTIVTHIDRSHAYLYLHVFDIAWQGGAQGVIHSTLAQEERVLRALAPQLLTGSALTAIGNNRGQHKRKHTAPSSTQSTGKTPRKGSSAANQQGKV